MELKDDKICGVWRMDHIVNLFSYDFDLIPASLLKTKDGNSFADFRFSFFEDGIMYIHYGDGNSASGRWWVADGKYRYQITKFVDIEASFEITDEPMEIKDDYLYFKLAFISFGMKREE